MAGKPLVTREQVSERVAHDFPAERVEEVLALLDDLRAPSGNVDGDEYLRMAVLRLVNGWFNGLRQYIDQANTDPRNLLMIVQHDYGNAWDVGFVPSETRKWK